MEKNPQCFGYWAPNVDECQKNCSLIRQCRIYQEENILEGLNKKYKLENGDLIIR